MNTQYIRFFETSHSKSRGRQSVFDSIQNNPDFQPELGEWEVYYGLLPVCLPTSNNRWILIYMDSFQFAFQH